MVPGPNKAPRRNVRVAASHTVDLYQAAQLSALAILMLYLVWMRHLGWKKENDCVTQHSYCATSATNKANCLPHPGSSLQLGIIAPGCKRVVTCQLLSGLPVGMDAGSTAGVAGTAGTTARKARAAWSALRSSRSHASTTAVLACRPPSGPRCQPKQALVPCPLQR